MIPLKFRFQFLMLILAFFPRESFSSSVEIVGGQFTPFDSAVKISDKTALPMDRSVKVEDFGIDPFPVTNQDFLSFLKVHSEWRKSKVRKIFADVQYLQHWPSDLNFGAASPRSPVTRVSWFAANAYCESLNKSLPSTEQWEFALYNNGRHLNELNEKILEWYGKPNPKKIPQVGTGWKNDFGVYDLGTLVWEWTEDFNSFLSVADSRSTGKDSNLFCGNGSQMGNPADYAAFMRYSFRASLKANYATANLGFRCAQKKMVEVSK